MNRADCLPYLRSLLPSLKGVERRLGEYLAENPEEFLNLTTARLAEKLGVSEGSVNRFCRRMGCSGFPDLKLWVAQSLSEQKRFVLGDIAVDSGGDAFSVAGQVFRAVERVLQETRNLLDPEALRQAVEKLRSASRVELYGLGTSGTIVEDAYYRFMRMGRKAAACVDPHIMTVSASQLEPGCLAIAVSHTGRSVQTVEALRLAREHGADTLCITSYAGSPITRFADIALITSPGGDGVHEATAARMAHIALLDSLCVSMAMEDGPEAAAKERELRELLERQRC